MHLCVTHWAVGRLDLTKPYFLACLDDVSHRQTPLTELKVGLMQ